MVLPLISRTIILAVGVLLRAIQDRVGFVGTIIADHPTSGFDGRLLEQAFVPKKR